MTTIAANREMMASDSKVTLGYGVAYRAVKIVRVKGMLVGACGDGGDCTRMFEWAERNFKDPKPKWMTHAEDEQSVWALVLKSDGIYFVAQDDSAPEKMDEQFFAIGSGGKAARAAMLLGKAPDEAVDIACQVDNDSGLPIQILLLSEKKSV